MAMHDLERSSFDGDVDACKPEHGAEEEEALYASCVKPSVVLADSEGNRQRMMLMVVALFVMVLGAKVVDMFAHSFVAIHERGFPSSSVAIGQHEFPSFFVAILSRRDAVDRRKVLRQARAGLSKSSLNVKMKFLICQGKGGATNEELALEATQFGDIHQLPCEENYQLLTEMVTDVMQAYLDDYGDRDLFMKMDDDIFVSWTRLKPYLVNQDISFLYMGFETASDFVSRKVGFPWYVSREDWPYDTFPRTMQGGAYILSHNLVKRVLDASKHADLLWHREDRRTAYLVEMVNTTGTPVNYVNIPGTSGYTKQDFEKKTGVQATMKRPNIIKSGSWSNYPYCMHHHLSAKSIKCLDEMDAVGDDDAIVDPCFVERVVSSAKPSHARVGRFALMPL